MRIYNGPISIPAGLVQSKRRFCNLSSGKAFDIRNVDKVTEIDLYDEIGWYGVDAKTFRSMLRGAGDVKLRIHSPGGDVFDGISIYNDLLDHKGRVDVEISGLAASSASLIAMAGDTIKMAPSSFLMIHNVWTVVVGDRHDMRDTANMMEPIDTALADVYVARSGNTLPDIDEMMNVETWLPAEKAVSSGFADGVIEGEEPQARFDLSGFKNAPRQWSLSKKDPPKTKRDHEQRLMHDAGYSRSQARAMLRGDYSDMQDAVAPDTSMQDAGMDLVNYTNQVLKELTL